ncbi:glycosyltransferase [Streptococcus equi]|uniref:glycosyltransferase n=1 Tax=Streptococcus equi TaxID=1336 RepID=UPI0032D9A2B0
MIKEKGMFFAAGGFEQLTYKDRAVLVVAGDGPLLASLRDSYKEDQSIIFTGKLNFAETMSLLSQSDIFVNPSIYAEGLPTAVLEAGLLKVLYSNR